MDNTWLIRNARIVDGSGKQAFDGAVLIRDGVIAEVCRGGGEPAFDGPAIDAKGAYLTPGFVDIHRHGDWKALRAPLGGDDELLNRQGITSVVNGNCGLSVAPLLTEHAQEIASFLKSVPGPAPEGVVERGEAETLGTYLSRLKTVPRTVNTGMLAGNGTIRAAIAGYHPGKLTSDERKRVQSLVEQCLSEGALGVSLGVAYAPEFEYDAEGLIEALAPLKDSGVPIATHIRSEGDGYLESLEEVIRVAEALRIPLHVSHMKCIGRRNWITGPEKELALIDRKTADGMKIDFDLYPYRTGSTQLLHVIPPEFQSGGVDVFLRNLKDPSFRHALRERLRTPSADFENIVELVGFENITASSMRSVRFHAYSGQTIGEIAEKTGSDPYETLFDILSEERCEVPMLDTIACREDMVTFYRDPRASVISDAIYPDGGKVHPRVYAAFPRFLIDFVRDDPVFPIEEAVAKMTSRPASVYGLKRGRIEAGYPADLDLFRLENIKAPASFAEPEQMSSGFDLVMVNGRIVVRDDRWIPSDAGVILSPARSCP